VSGSSRAGIALAVVTAIGFHPACNALFRCGCGVFSLAQHCNVHHATGPHCPFCAHPLTALAAVLVATAAGWGALVLARRRAGGRFVPSFLAGLVAIALALVGTAAITAAATGYPHFLH
jgi:hypothetical protein